ncbi:YebC/PmpR family DNA-binding transcriptional regulator [Candidatus Acetothermia bacterium]|jgi:YebC/PmpR family DNA-binding regulatory protein|nr:YebC/PmpR family DNA-binding transcriptional regulator [Candidatus Acetothermia bacterium]MCI2427395.1 YebC/PmpR family DNA-binding transcriptional regulator [Candidatus Acetothermia bacterium]MCI2428782.1 YebC/PmpR family DNA-binding transcriptional regulator [Candidatus Acetothermia bacterium]
MAGHSKWANIKHRKERQDRKKSDRFAKILKEITLQARFGSPDPNNNAALAQVLERARAANIPKDNIKKAIQRATGELDGSLYEEIPYEGYGAGGVAILLRVVTDNRNRAAASIRHIFNAYGGHLGTAGSVAWIFARKGLFVIEELPDDINKDDLMMTAIELGAQDVYEDDETLEIICEPTHFMAILQGIREIGVVPVRAENTMIPQTTVRIEGEQAQRLLKMIDALDSNEDVQEVFANFDVPDELLTDTRED